MNLRDLTGWFNSTLAGRFVVSADTGAGQCGHDLCGVVGRATPYAPFGGWVASGGAHGVTRPTLDGSFAKPTCKFEWYALNGGWDVAARYPELGMAGDGLAGGPRHGRSGVVGKLRVARQRQFFRCYGYAVVGKRAGA